MATNPPLKNVVLIAVFFFLFHDTELLCANSNAVVDVSNPGGAADSKQAAEHDFGTDSQLTHQWRS